VTDAFDTPKQEAEFDHDLPDERGRWGWYKLKHPETMDAMTARRASSFGKVIGDRTTLEKWGERMAVLGMASRPDLFSLVHGKEVKRDSKELNALIDEAKKAAGSGTAANLGTALHGYCEQLDCGRWTLDDAPQMHRADVAAYKERMESSGLKAFPDLIERITYVPELKVAGKFDRIVQLPDGSYAIADLKTGSIEYSIMEIEIQLALYAHGVNTSGIWNKRDRDWDTPSFKVREGVAVIMHLPVGQGVCELSAIDIKRGWENAQLCDKIMKARKPRYEPVVFGHASDLPAEVPSGWIQNSDEAARLIDAIDSLGRGRVKAPAVEPSWCDRFAAVQSREQASKLYQEAKSQVTPSYLAKLVNIAKEALKNLP